MKRLLNIVAVMLASVLILCVGAGFALAQAGVGISPGKIRVDEPLFPGSYYKLPPLQVTNTGSVASQYEVSLSRMAALEELQPTEDFISFSPASFYLEPGARQAVSLNLNIPAGAEPGDYLAYVAAQPVSPAVEGGAAVGIAAATKLYFTIEPANILVSIGYAIASFFTKTAPVSYIVLGVIVLVVIIFLLRKYVRLEVRGSQK